MDKEVGVNKGVEEPGARAHLPITTVAWRTTSSQPPAAAPSRPRPTGTPLEIARESTPSRSERERRAEHVDEAGAAAATADDDDDFGFFRDAIGVARSEERRGLLRCVRRSRAEHNLSPPRVGGAAASGSPAANPLLTYAALGTVVSALAASPLQPRCPLPTRHVRSPRVRLLCADDAGGGDDE